MGIIADYEVGSDVVKKDASITIGRIWGSKEEGWNAWVNDGDVTLGCVNVPFVTDVSPYPSLYSEVSAMSIFSNIRSDEITSEPIKKVSKKKLKDI